MQRVLACLASSLLAACAASHAAPAPQAVVVGGPIDPYAGDPYAGLYAGDDRRESLALSCAPGSTCAFECPQGNCEYFCAEGSTCNIECNGGGCRASCGGEATCNIECDGGRCGTACGPGASCNVECDGGNCAQACAPEASCNVECDGGNCT